MEKKVYLMPNEINDRIARMKLASMGIEIDALTEEQKAYLGLA
jgi:adenosylhomocysteinase